jgi:hypothetical protein
LTERPSATHLEPNGALGFGSGTFSSRVKADVVASRSWSSLGVVAVDSPIVGKGSACAIKTDRSVFRLSAPSHAAETVAEPLLDINTDACALETSASPVDEITSPFKLWSLVGQSLDPSATSVFPSVPSGRLRGFRPD